jgi:DNA-binding Lrp family transcriptional regulator
MMRAAEVSVISRDRLFRNSTARASLLVITILAVCVALVIFHWPRPRAAYYISGAILLGLLLMRRFILARFRPSNWLVKLTEDGVFLKFRSYLNYHLPAENLTVVFIPHQDIRSARLVRERSQTRDMEGGTAERTRRLVELELGVDPGPLAAALAVERARQAPLEKNWYGITESTLYAHYPVSMPNPPFLRVEWQIVPGASVFLDALSPKVTIAPLVVVSEDFAKLTGLTREQQESRLRELDERGQTIAAVYMARRLYAYDLTQATTFVKGLRGSPRS